MSDGAMIAPEWSSEQWLNTQDHHSLSDFKGKVVMLHAFQMLCPGCVSHALPQAQHVWDTFRHDDLMVIGLHSVFEHHEAMKPNALAAFVHEYRLSFPIMVDAPSADVPHPQTMRVYGMRGTPSMVLIDRSGIIRRHSFGRVDDLILGAELMALIADDTVPRDVSAEGPDSGGAAARCTDWRCAIVGDG